MLHPKGKKKECHTVVVCEIHTRIKLDVGVMGVQSA